MNNKSLENTAAFQNGAALVKQRDEQIRRVLSAAQYKKYKDIEKSLQPQVPSASLVSSPHNPDRNN